MRIRIGVKNWIRVRIRIKVKNLRALKAQNKAVEGCGRSKWRLKIEPCRVCRPEVNNLHRFDEDPGQHLIEKSDSDSHCESIYIYIYNSP
jgi:hypothetical protein